MYKTFLILILLNWTYKGYCATSTDDIGTEPKWFQIELLIFANEEKTADSEFWPAADLHYPAKMLTIGPWRDELLQPTNLGQLNDIIEYRKIIESAPTDQVTPAGNSEDKFLFDTNKRTPSRRKRSSTLDAEDLMSGLNPESSQFEPHAAVLPDSATDQSINKDPAVHDSLESVAMQLQKLFSSKLIADAFRTLPVEELNLRNIARRLQRSANYRVLYHVSWRQPIVAIAQAIPILVQAGNRFDDYYELDGTVTISLARYLHLDTDLWFTSFLPRYSSQLNLAAAQRSRGVFSSDERELISQYPELYRFESRRDSYRPERTHKLVQSRRMRSAKLHYLDHPAFGLMVKITEYRP